MLTAGEPPPYVKAIDIRTLSPAEANQRKSVRFRGTFIFSDPGNAIFLQDETAGLHFWIGDRPIPNLVPGDIVEVQGRVRPGIYVPGLSDAAFRVVGHGEMPSPQEANHDDLISGRFHYQWVAVEGVVRTVANGAEDRSILRIAMGARIVEVHLSDKPPEQNLVDCFVRVTGLAAGSINDSRQLVRPFIWPHDHTAIQVIKPAPPESLIPPVPAADLLTFRHEGRTGNRVRVKGTVLAAFPDGRMFVRDDQKAFALHLAEPGEVQPGDVIEALGFPEMERFSASVADAVITSRAKGADPAPIPITPASLLRGKADNDLVTFEGEVSDSFRAETGTSILLESERGSIRIHAPKLRTRPSPTTKLRVTGICQVDSTRLEPVGEFSYTSRPESISVHLRTVADITILETPSWWSPARLQAAMFALAGGLVFSLLWILVLRRQVYRQTTTLRQRIEYEAMLEERQRIAREFHDTLEQDLTGLSLQIGAAAARAAGKAESGPLETARNLVSRIQTEVRNLLGDLRTPADQALDLASSLFLLAAQLQNSRTPRIEVKTEEPLPALPPRSVHHLRMVARESVTNAIRHASPAQISIHLRMIGDRIAMTIADDGSGFDSASETWEKSGHFGCMGIRERSRKLGAEVRWISSPGKGTRVEVILPPGKKPLINP